MTEQTKACTKCGETKALDEFYEDKRGRLGRFARCKPCFREYARRSREMNPEEYRRGKRESSKRRYWNDPERARAEARRYREQNPGLVDREAARERNRRWRERHPDRARMLARENAKHRYQKDPERARELGRTAHYRERSETLPTAVNNGKEWTGPEMELVADRSRTAREVALALGRTIGAVKIMRHKLRTDPRKIKVAGIPERDEP